MSSKIALVTGASSGLGENLSRLLIEAGWVVVGVARSREKLEDLQKSWGERFHSFVCDVSRPEQVQETSHALKRLGLRPSLFFLNAGHGVPEDDGVLETRSHRDTFEVNYFGALGWIEQWLLEGLGEGATFVAVSSLVGEFATPRAAAYCASKSALSRAFQSLRLQYHGTRLSFITVLPGPIATSMLKSEKPVPFVWPASRAAQYILRKVSQRRALIVFPLFYRVFFSMLPLLPSGIAARILR